jgi:16S rRNA (guanine527-N7)-methyltransferase
MIDAEKETPQLVADEMRRLGLADALAASTADRLARYVTLVVRWGRRINLTGRPEAPAFVQRQLPDGLVLARQLLSTAQGSVSLLDVGTGAGLPGLVVSLLCPQAGVTLLESNQRRCSFLRTAIFELELGRRCSLVEQRLERATLPAPVSVACSRATWPPSLWLERAKDLVGVGGEVVAFLSEDADEPQPPATLHKVEELSYLLVDGTRRRQLFYRRVSRET